MHNIDADDDDCSFVFLLESQRFLYYLFNTIPIASRLRIFSFETKRSKKSFNFLVQKEENSLLNVAMERKCKRRILESSFYQFHGPLTLNNMTNFRISPIPAMNDQFNRKLSDQKLYNLKEERKNISQKNWNRWRKKKNFEKKNNLTKSKTEY